MKTAGSQTEWVCWAPGCLTATPRSRVLRLLLARGVRTESPATHPDEVLFGLFNRSTHPLPFAAATHAADSGAADDRLWLRADPVHLALGHRQAFLADPQTLALSAAEAQSLGAELRPAFVDRGLDLEVLHAQRWYVPVPDLEGLATRPIDQAVGGDVFATLPTGKWRVLLNEAQMILHEARVNRVREDEGRPVVNSVWLWGEGGLLPSPAPWSTVHTDDPVVSGLARAAALVPQPLSQPVAALLAAAGPGRHLLAFGAGEGRRSQAPAEAPLAELFEGLRGGAIDRLELIDGRALLTLTARRARRWWRLF